MNIKATLVIPAGEFKAQCLKLMDEVQETHKPIVITKRGIPVAKLIPFEEQPVDLFGALKGTITITEDIISPIKENWEADE